MHQLVHLFRLAKILEAVRAEMTKRGVRRQGIGRKTGGHRREQRLPAMAERLKPRDAKQRRAEVVVAALLDCAGMQRNAHRDATDRSPFLHRQGAVRVKRGGDAIRGGGEGGIHGVTHRLEDCPCVTLDNVLEQFMVTGQGDAHRGAVPLQQLRAALDVAEQERDRSGRQLHHEAMVTDARKAQRAGRDDSFRSKRSRHASLASPPES